MGIYTAYINNSLKPERDKYKKEAREQRARALNLEDEILETLLELCRYKFENEILIDEVKRLKQELKYIKKPYLKQEGI